VRQLKLYLWFSASLVLLFGGSLAFAQSDFWQQADGPLGSPINALVSDAAGNLFAGTAEAGIFRSTDNGDSWMQSGLGIAVYSFAVSTEGIIFAGTGDGVYRSLDQGDNWLRLDTPQTGLPQTLVYSLTISPSGTLFAGTHNGVILYSHDNGDTWSLTSLGLTNDVWSLATNSSGHIFAGTFEGGVWRSVDDGQTWVQINNGLVDNYNVNAVAVNANDLVFAATYAGVYRSADNGDTWVAINNGLTNTLDRALVINGLGHLFLATEGGGVFKSVDDGDTWTAINSGLTDLVVTALTLNPTGHLFAGTRPQSQVFRSVESTTAAEPGGPGSLVFLDGSPAYRGQGWDNAIDGDLEDWDGTVTTRGDTIGQGPAWAVFQGPAWAIFGFDSSKAATFNSVAIQTDNGVNKPYVLRRQARELEVLVSNTDTADSDFVSVGRIVRTSGEMQVHPLDTMVTAKYVKLVIYKPNNTSGCWRQLVEFKVVMQENEPLAASNSEPLLAWHNGAWPEKFILHQNYPNPFNPLTTIAYELPEDGLVSLRVYDLTGREVANLASGWQAAGIYTIPWDATGLASGTYFYKLISGSDQAVRRLLLVK